MKSDTTNVTSINAKRDADLARKIDSLSFPDSCPCCGWKKKTGKQMCLMLETIYKIQDAIYPIMPNFSKAIDMMAASSAKKINVKEA